MTSARKDFTAEFDKLFGMVGLTGWHINLKFVPVIDGAWANVQCSPTSAQADFTVGEDLFAEPWALQRQVILHELMHVVARDLIQYAKNALEELDITAGTRAQIASGINHQEELLVDRLAMIIERATR